MEIDAANFFVLHKSQSHHKSAKRARAQADEALTGRDMRDFLALSVGTDHGEISKFN